MHMTKQPLVYPEHNLAFVGARNVTDINNAYINLLESTGLKYHKQYAKKLYEFKKVDNKKQKRSLQREYKALKNFTKNWGKKQGVKVLLSVRKKDWIGFNAKILLFQKNGRDLDAIRDLLGFKLILVTEFKDSARTHQLCYKLLNDLLDFLKLNRHCTLLEAEPKSGTPFNPINKTTNIFIYNKNEIKPEYKGNVKNYLISPKEDLYQALHTYVRTPSGLVLEIQIHTTATHVQAQKLHAKYKNMRYEDITIHIDYEAINIPGLVFDENGNVLFDCLGIFLSDFKFLEDDE